LVWKTEYDSQDLLPAKRVQVCSKSHSLFHGIKPFSQEKGKIILWTVMDTLWYTDDL